jgi:hypothetical protein
MSTIDDRNRLRALIAGFQASQAISVAASIGLADHLAGGPRSAAELAQLTTSDPQALQRLAMALSALGILRHGHSDKFALTSMGQLLRQDVSGSQAFRARLMGRPFFWKSWELLSHSIASGLTAFEEAHGVDGWTWRNAHPEDGALFDAVMAADAEWMGEAIVEAYDFSRFSHIVDVGGGDGSLLVALASRYASLRGTVLEQPRVADEARRALSLARLADRCGSVGGDFFTDMPAGADAYILKWILHNWSDRDCGRLLRNCRNVMDREACLLIVEHICDPEHPEATGALMDLNMLVMNGGRERTTAEFAALLRDAGFEPRMTFKTSAGISILEAAPT